MKERPIIFSGPMVRAILEGRKTQTRRVVKPQPPKFIETGDGASAVLGWHEWGEVLGGPGWAIGAKWGMKPWRDGPKCPLGKPGELLWVRETWRLYDSSTECACYDYCTCSRFHGKPIYKASQYDLEGPWRSPVSMPRWASRITLEITDVRVERLNDISEEDARAEGIIDGGCENCGCSEPCGCPNPNPLPIDGFIDSWETIHGDGSWYENPWVWVYTFKMVDK